jgi:hypothetical protein
MLLSAVCRSPLHSTPKTQTPGLARVSISGTAGVYVMHRLEVVQVLRKQAGKCEEEADAMEGSMGWSDGR